MKKELNSGILLDNKSADHRPTVGRVNVITVFVFNFFVFLKLFSFAF